MHTWLSWLIGSIVIVAACAPGRCEDGSAATGTARVPLLTNDEAWGRLPESEVGQGEPLPNWARALAATLPHTTAALLELDFLYRTSTEIDPKLRAAMRWTAARANRCDYTQRYAEADLRRAGATDAEVEALGGDLALRSPAERAALAFARDMATAAWMITDEQVAELIGHYGERQVVAMVLQLAYANFQDRLVLLLGVPLEEDGPLAPQDFRFTALHNPEEIPQQPRPELPANDEAADASAAAEIADKRAAADWSDLDIQRLEQLVERQRERPARITVPDGDEIREKLPPGMAPLARMLRINWALVVLGNQPELGGTWLRCMRIFGRESHLDRVLAESIFWVVTRSIHCFY